MFSSSYSHYLFCRKSGRHFVFSAVRRFLLDVNYFKIHNGKFYHKTFRIKNEKKILCVFIIFFFLLRQVSCTESDFGGINRPWLAEKKTRTIRRVWVEGSRVSHHIVESSHNRISLIKKVFLRMYFT